MCSDGHCPTVGGIIAFVLGAFFLFRPFTPPTDPLVPEIGVSPFLIAGLALLTTLFLALVLTAAIRTRRVRSFQASDRSWVRSGLPKQR